MKLLHTADLHLGKTLKGQSLIDDQEFILDEIFKVIDAFLIAGDVYDRGIPPAEAVSLFDETLNKLAEKNLPTLIIAGNHDSATRLNFGSKLFERQNIFIASRVTDTPAQVRFIWFSTRCNMLSPPASSKSFRNCFERMSLDSGHNLCPLPPDNKIICM